MAQFNKKAISICSKYTVFGIYPKIIVEYFHNWELIHIFGIITNTKEMTLEDLHQKLSSLAFSGMEDNHFISVDPKNGNGPAKAHLSKTKRKRLKKESNVQLSLFE